MDTEHQDKNKKNIIARTTNGTERTMAGNMIRTTTQDTTSNMEM